MMMTKFPLNQGWGSANGDDVHDRRTANSHDSVGGKSGLEQRQSLADAMCDATAQMHNHVVPIGFDPVNLLWRNEDYAVRGTERDGRTRTRLGRCRLFGDDGHVMAPRPDHDGDEGKDERTEHGP